MDACTYESITGLKNYYGFKSLLKNGGWTQRYGCDDDTIVFNRIEQHVQFSGGLSLNPNQVGVLLNCTSQLANFAPNMYLQDGLATYTVDNTLMWIQPNSYNIGQVFVRDIFFGVTFGVGVQITFAIFDLY